jgi:hypothetical protein
MTDPLSLDALLDALRQAGLPIGITETIRLQRVFALQPGSADARQLKSILRAILVKGGEDDAVFDRVVEAWLARAASEVEARAQRPLEPVRRPARRSWQPPAAASKGSETETRKKVWPYALVGALILLCILVAYRIYSSQPSPPGENPGEPLANQTTKPSTPPLAPVDLRRQRFTSWTPSLTVTPASPIWTGGLPLALAGLAAAAAGGVWLTLGRRRWLPEPAPAPTRKGPPRVFLPPANLAGAQLLDARQQEALVWGIGRFIADEPTRLLDMAATVKATAAGGGIPALRFERAVYQREVWLWVDETADDPALARLADEVEAALVAHGLPVERAAFRGIPDRLVSAAGAIFAAREIDERRDVALVAVLTDGRVLCRQYEAGDRRVRVDALLRNLSHWPHLAFVDFSAAASELAAILAPHDIERIAPGQLAAFLGGGTIRATVAGQRADVAMWAAACALAPAPVAEATALALRRTLRLSVAPWALRQLRAEADGPPGRLQWPPSRRAQRLNWLRQVEGDLADGILPGSLLDRALGFWEQAYEHELAERAARDDAALWQGTPAHQHLLMERHCLRLWRPAQAGEAIAWLYELHQGALRTAVREQLAQLAPQPKDDPGAAVDGGKVQLPWSWEDRHDAERAMLQEMGFGGDKPTERLRPPGRLWLGLGACLGLAAGGLAAALLIPDRAPGGPPIVSHGENRPTNAREYIERVTDGQWQVAVNTAKWAVGQHAGDAADVQVAWRQQERACVETLASGAELWRCGSSAALSRVDDKASRRLVALQTAPTPAAARLAAALLAGGSADVVLFDAAWPAERQALLGAHDRLADGQQLLVIRAGPPPANAAATLPAGGNSSWLQTSDWPALTAALDFSGAPRLLAQVWPGVTVLAGDPAQFLLAGVGGCQPGQIAEDPSGMTFVRICAGHFPMGSPAERKRPRR